MFWLPESIDYSWLAMVNHCETIVNHDKSSLTISRTLLKPALVDEEPDKEWLVVSPRVSAGGINVD